MEHEKQVCSLEYAKRLKELGVKQESLFWWEKCPDVKNEFVISCGQHHDLITGEWTNCHLLEDQENYSAFTVGELGEMLGASCNYYMKCDRFFTRNTLPDANFYTVNDETEANSRARMLIFMLEKRKYE